MATDVAVRAAGALVWRPSRRHGVKLALVHRPRYDDWSLPKGKAVAGELAPQTAAREVLEETGFAVAIGRVLSTATYRVAAGMKSVEYFSARRCSGGFEPNDEVDRFRWVTVERARRMMSYDFDHAVLDAFATRPVDLRTVLLVRHGKAGHRESYDGDDLDRPLDAKGRKQAQSLIELLRPFVPLHVLTAPLPRCEQTVQPLADSLGLTVGHEPLLTEDSYRDQPAAARRRVAGLAELVGSDDAGSVVACSQGGVIPGVVKSLAGRAGTVINDASTPKAAYWVLSFDAKDLVQADPYPAPRI